MVERITPVAGTASSGAPRIDQSVSLAEPDIAWTAERQSAINERLFSDKRRSPPDVEHHHADTDRKADHHASDISGTPDDEAEEHLSGESERIGSGNLDDDVPFGDHLGYI